MEDGAARTQDRQGPMEDALERAKALARAALTKERRRTVRRVEAIREDLAKGAAAQERADRARWFVAAASSAPRGARELTVIDSSGEPLSLTLDPARPARAQLEVIFTTARRMQRGATIARARLAEAEASLLGLAAKLGHVEAATTQEELEAVLAGDERERPAVLPRPQRGKDTKRRPYRLFASSLRAPILVGKRAADNDALTFKVARPRDLWLHARGIEGAHVILPLSKGKEPTASDLVDAAHLAAHFSGHRGEPTVEVDYATRGHVRKPRGSPPGLVVLDHGKTLLVRTEPARLAALLASEETDTPTPKNSQGEKERRR
jgi:predicted ribosome quality control (RQC) complex YloA/Tae2 family protein